MASLNLSLRHLEVFCAVVERGSLSDAAHFLHVSPSGISLALTELERRIGTQLTVRIRGKGVAITPAGHSVYRSAKKAIHAVEEIDTAVAAARGEVAGPLRIGVFTTLSPWVFPAVAEFFATAHPGVSLEVEEESSSALQAMLLDGELDAAILYENHLVGDVDSQLITPVRLQLALSAEHPLAESEAVSLQSLRDDHAIIFGVRPVSDHVEEVLRDAGLPLRVRWRSRNIETVRALVARNLGYAVIMGRPHGDHSYEGKPIVYRPIAEELPPNALVMATARGTQPTAKVESLLRFCREELSGLWQR